MLLFGVRRPGGALARLSIFSIPNILIPSRPRGVATAKGADKAAHSKEGAKGSTQLSADPMISARRSVSRRAQARVSSLGS